MTIWFGYARTPVGRLLLAAGEEGVVRISFENEGRAAEPEDDWLHDESRVGSLRTQIDEYFAGTRKEFSLKLAPAGTEFQRSVWDALCAIPYGETRSYADIAKAIGRPSATRAVGAANGANPIPIVIPCHRVIGSSGALTGFGGGIEVKKFLLALEDGHAQRAFVFAIRAKA